MAGLKTNLLGAALALVLVGGILTPTAASAEAGSAGPASEPVPYFQEANPPQPVIDDSGDDDDVYIGLAAGVFAALVLLGLGVGVFGLRED